MAPRSMATVGRSRMKSPSMTGTKPKLPKYPIVVDTVPLASCSTAVSAATRHAKTSGASLQPASSANFSYRAVGTGSSYL